MRSFLFSLTILLGSVIPSFGQQDAILKYFSKYVDDPNFSSVYVSPKMFSMVAKVEIEDLEPEVQDVIRSMKGLRILHTEKNTLQLYQDANKTLQSNYEELMTARDGGENVRFLVKDNGNLVEELVMLVGGADNFALISFSGNIDLQKIGKLAKALKIDNLNYLEHLDSKGAK